MVMVELIIAAGWAGWNMMDGELQPLHGEADIVCSDWVCPNWLDSARRHRPGTRGREAPGGVFALSCACWRGAVLNRPCETKARRRARSACWGRPRPAAVPPLHPGG